MSEHPFHAPGTVAGVAFGPAGLGALLVGDRCARLMTYDPQDGSTLAALPVDFEARGLLADGEGWLAWSHDRLARLEADGAEDWSVAQGVFRASIAVGVLATVHEHHLTVRSANDGALRWSRDLSPDDPFVAAVSPDGARVAVGTQKGQLLLLDARGGELARRKRTKVLALAFTPDGTQLLVGHGQGDVRLVDGQTLAEIRGFIGAKHTFEPSGPAGVRWAWTDGQTSLTLGNERRIRSWSTPSGVAGAVLEIPRHHAQGCPMAVSEDGRFVAVGASLKWLTCFDRLTGSVRPAEIPVLPEVGLRSGDWRAELGRDHVALFDGDARVAQLPCGTQAKGAVFGPDGAWVATIDTGVTVWSVGSSPRKLARVELDWGDLVVRGVTISGHGRIVISADTWDNHFTAESALLFVDVGTGTVETLAAPDAHRLGGVGWIGGDRFAVADSIGRVHVAEPGGWVEVRETCADPLVPYAREVFPLVAEPGRATHRSLDGHLYEHRFEVGDESFVAPAFEVPKDEEPQGLLDERQAGAAFLFTGKFRRTSKAMREQTVAELGAKVTKSVKKATHVVVGVDPYNHKPSKAETEARAAIAAGADKELLDETEFLALAMPTRAEVELLLTGLDGGKERYRAWIARARDKAYDIALSLGPVSLAGADLSDLDFRYFDLAGADLHGANLTNAQFERANLRGADLGETILERTGLYHAQLHGADLRGAHIPQKLYVVAYDDSTQWPEGIELPRQP